MAGEVAERLALAGEHALRPCGSDSYVDHVGEPPFRRNRHAVADVAMPLPQHLEINGEHERAALGANCTFDQRAREAAILHNVELEPERPVDRRGDIFDRAD